MKFYRIIPTILFLLVISGFHRPGGIDWSTAKKVPAIERGTLLLRTNPKALDSFIVDGKINMQHINTVCNFLTDNDSIYFNGFLVPKKKKAFTYHIKQQYEQLAEAAADNRAVDDKLMEIIFELALFSESLKQKTLETAHPAVSFHSKVEMFRDSKRSNKIFQYKKEITDHEAVNAFGASADSDPPDSPFWHAQTTAVPPDQRFDHLARLKKIKAKPRMIVVFDKTSLTGSAPKIDVMDLDMDNAWSMKWGDEVHTDPVGSRIFAALGYDVDHPYYYGENEVTLVFDGLQEIKNAEALKSEIKRIYKTDLAPFITSSGIITAELIALNSDLRRYDGKQFVCFKECLLEARPDRVKRIGSFVPYLFSNEDRRELRGALLAHAFIGNWDTREENTALTSVHVASRKYRMSAIFSDLGTSFGVKYGIFPADFKVGLVNEFGWEAVTTKNGVITLENSINSILPCYEKATYYDLLWMAKKIATLDSIMLRNMVAEGHWPQPIAELYFQKLASRRASVLKAFNITDEHPIAFDKMLTISSGGVEVVKNGKLVVDLERNKNPESFFFTKGRFRNYGN
jgi:hypothetical protein